MTTFTRTLRQHYEQHPQQTCIHLVQPKQADVPVSYAQLVQHAHAYAQALRCVSKGDVVIIILEHGTELLYAFWGAVLRGAVPSILPFLTEKLLPEKYLQDLAALVRTTQPAAILTYPAFAERFRAELSAMQTASGAPIILSVTDAQPSEPNWDELDGMSRDTNDIAILQHSSGSTGLQKGVALSHQAVFNQLHAYAQTIALNPADCIVSWLPLYHDMGFISSFLMPVLLGVPLVLLSPFDWVRAPAKLLHLMTRYGGTLCWLPNFAFNFMAQKIRDRDLEGVELSRVRAFINCSEPTFAASHTLFAEKFARYGLHTHALATSYAMAENVFAVTQSELGEPVATGSHHAAALLSAGKPLPNVRVRIVGEHNADLAENDTGEIAIQSDCMLSGYYKRDDLTTSALVHGWYFTGDLGYMHNGELFVTGRKKDLIIVGGKNVYPQDLERLASDVAGVHPGRVVAFGLFNTTAGTEDVVLICETDITGEEERMRLSDSVRSHVTQNSDVAVRTVQLVDAGWLIKTSSGKIARAANKQQYSATFL